VENPAYVDKNGDVLRVILFENALEGIEASEQPLGSDIMMGYPLRTFVNYNLWFDLADKVAITSFADGFTLEEEMADFLDKYLALEGGSAPIVCGPTQDKNWAVWQVGYLGFGLEAVFTMSGREELSVLDLFEAVGMKVADAYDFVCTDGYTHKIAAEDIPDCMIARNDGRIDGFVPGIGEYTLMDVVAIQVSGLEQPDVRVSRITVFENGAIGLASSEQPFGSDKRVGYSVADFAQKNFTFKPSEDVTIVASDGYTATEAYALFVEKYICLQGSDAPIVIGASQDKNWAVWNMAHISFGRDAVCFMIGDSVSVAELFEALGMVEAASYNFACTDGYVHNIKAADIGDCFIEYRGSSIDGIVPGIGEYTLMELLYIEPAG